MKNITVIAVHNDAKTAFMNTVNRGIATGRFLSLEYFLDGAFRDNKGKIAALLKKHQEINLIAIDNSNNNGGKVVSNEEATNWDYNISEELVYNLLTYIQERFDNGEITKEQLSSIGRGIQEIEELTSKRNEQIASRIAREISSNDLHETSGERVSGLGVNTPSADTPEEQPLG